MDEDRPARDDTDAATKPSPRGRRPRASTASVVEQDVVRKPVNTLAIIPKSTRITSLGRKGYNGLLFEAQEQGLERDVFKSPLDRIIKGVDFDSNDHGLIKKHLRAMVSTLVEWQSPTAGEGGAWNVSGLLAHAKLTKERGQVWVEWSYAVNLKQELLEPTVFARLKLEIISQLRSHAGIALYEICTRYKDIGRTARQPWRWWRPVLSGQPETEKTARLEYRIFKRDTLKPAIAEVSAITDIEVELVEHKEGRFVGEIQFLVRPKQQTPLPLRQPHEPLDLSLMTKARGLGIDDDKAEELVQDFGAAAVSAGLDLLERRIAAAFPEPLRDRYRYLRSLMPGELAKVEQGRGGLKPSNPVHASAPSTLAHSGAAAGSEAQQARRQARWTEEWRRRQRERVIRDIEGMPADAQAKLVSDLLEDMTARQVHPSIRKRLQTSGWQHPMALHEMVRFYASATWGEDWDKPTPQQLLDVAGELGDA
jgi:hypothetical protein